VQANTNIVKLGITITEAHYSNEINKQLMKNRDKVRQDRKTFAAQCSASLRSSVFRRISVGSKSPECAAELASALSADLGSETASSLAGLDANVTTTGSPERSKVRFEVPDVEDEEAQQVEKTTSVTKTTSIASSVGTESSEVWDIHEANSMPADLDANVTITGSPERSKVRFEAPEVEDEEAQQVEKTTSVTSSIATEEAQQVGKTTSITSSIGTESSETWDIHETNSMQWSP